ncbi:unnamed protein product, partial [marine sediment metagenome]
MPLWLPQHDLIESRYDDDWELDSDSSLWRGCKLFLGGKGGGDLAVDSSLYGNHGTVLSGVTPATGLDRRGWDFPGTDDAVIDLGAGEYVEGATALTASVWFFLRSGGTTYSK